jgi:hypothetical protein
MEMLRHIANAVRALTGRLTKNMNRPSIGRQEAKHELDQGGLATTIGAEKGDKAPSIQAEIDIPQDRNSIVRKPEFLDLNDGGTHATPHFSAVLNFNAASRRLFAQSRARGSTRIT